MTAPNEKRPEDAPTIKTEADELRAAFDIVSKACSRILRWAYDIRSAKDPRSTRFGTYFETRCVEEGFELSEFLIDDMSLIDSWTLKVEAAVHKDCFSANWDQMKREREEQAREARERRAEEKKNRERELYESLRQKFETNL